MVNELKDKPIFTGSQNYPTVYQLNTYKGRRSFDIRKYFRDKITNELKPTRKGISLNKLTFEALIMIISDSKKDISNWLEGNSEKENQLLSDLKKQSEFVNKELFKANEFTSDKENIRVNNLYRIENYGNKKKILLNENHEFMKIFNKLEDDSKKAIKILLISLDHAMSLFDKDEDVNFGVLQNEINENWGMLLKNYTKKLNE